MVLVFGSISSVLGVVYALHEHDIKRLLAYHSVCLLYTSRCV